MRISLINISIALVLFFLSCKENDITIDPIPIPSPEKVLEGTWNIIQTKAIGNVKVGNSSFPAEGSNLTPPKGYYILSVGENENSYSYDIETLLQLRFGKNGNTTQDYDYDDNDAGTWELKSDEQLTFYANQGNVQEIFFTEYDSANLQILQLSLPIDTTLNGFKYTGKIVVDMIKSK
ncbi:hypothetical protein OAA90_03885 [Salibacteraceae bacterium]|nr:hypothetical protein [Crocinitomicaceae bacterium]MDA9967869.1 hypothetical protein [Salibacteraceae bacterium]MDB9725499.1 hypothetical protein [Salibacteraceae bacterium]MDC1204313.1 hypothetical protein [Salibacteraceae bacterium]|tara:strand:+ start:7415 stop:7948 length:534 start_codon:yes stop_codon:yes gene_type:complete